MTNSDGISAIELYEETQSGTPLSINALGRTQSRMQTHYGDKKRHFERDQQALRAASALLSVNGTFEFKEEYKKFGYGNIFQAIAGELHEQGSNGMQKAENAREFEHVYRQGMQALNQKLLEDWSSTVIYSVPRQVDGKAIEFITTDPNLVVNDSGETAAQIFFKREEKRTKGQMTASAKKLTRSSGKDKALGVLMDVINNIEQYVQLPEGKRQHELDMAIE